MTLDGLWTGEFASTEGLFGGAVILVQGSAIMGGDSSYVINGQLQLDNSSHKLTAQVLVEPFIRDAESIFGTSNRRYTLRIAGTVSSDDLITGQGFPSEFPESSLSFRLSRKKI